MGLFSDVGETDADEFEIAAAGYLTRYKKSAAPKTTQRRLGTFRSYGKWLTGEETLMDYRSPSPGRSIPHPLPEGMDGVRRMLAACRNEEQKALVGLCGLAGLRVAESLAMDPSWVDFSEMVIRVIGKGHKVRTVPLSVGALQAIAPAVAAARHAGALHVVNYGDRGARRAITRLGEKAGLSRAVSSHDLRATFATAAYNKSLDIRAVQELMGHSSVLTTEVYTGITMGKMREASDV